MFTGWTEALVDLLGGSNVAVFNLEDRLQFYEQAAVETPDGFVKAVDHEGAARLASNGIYSTCYQWWPDVVLVVSAFFLEPRILDVLRSRGHKVVVLHTESPYEDGRQLRVAEHADLNLLNDPTNLDRFRAVAPAAYQPHCYRPAAHCPGPFTPEQASDFCFVGTGYPSRINFFESVDFAGVDVALAGQWQALAEGSPLRKYLAHDIDVCCDNAEAVQLYRGTKVSVNLYRKEAEAEPLRDGWAMGPREVELAACGTFFLREPRPESDALLAMLPTVESAEGFGDQVRWWLAHDEQRQAAAVAARSAVADRTFRNAAAGLLRRFDS